MKYEEIIEILHSKANPSNVIGMARFGISSKNTLGVSMPGIREIAKIIKKNHELAIELWDSEIHEARILAGLIAEPKKMTKTLADKWVADFDSWDVCDQVCSNLLDKVEFRDEKIFQWAESDEEFIRRAAFATIATDAVHNKKRDDEEYLQFFPIIIKYASDNRNFVRKAVNWAIRQIGKRSAYLNIKAIELCEELLRIYPEDKTVRWICADALRELTSEKILARIKK